jgi:hypothetical protein
MVTRTEVKPNITTVAQKHGRSQPLALGGEIIQDLNEETSLRRKASGRFLDDRIYDEGGPLR